MVLRQRQSLPLELIMFANPITVAALAVPLETEITECRHIQSCSQLIGEAYAQT